MKILLLTLTLAFVGCAPASNSGNSANKAVPQRPEETGNVSSSPEANRNTNSSVTASPSPQGNK